MSFLYNILKTYKISIELLVEESAIGQTATVGLNNGESVTVILITLTSSIGSMAVLLYTMLLTAVMYSSISAAPVIISTPLSKL